MPIALHQFTALGAAAQPGYLAAKELAAQCVDQFTLNVLMGPGGGIANQSCWAAVAVTPGAGFPAPVAVNPAGFPGTNAAAWGALPYSMVFGNSRMAMVNALVTVPGFGGGGHAERTALIAAGGAGLALYPLAGLVNAAVLFVQLSPCIACGNWLVGGGGGVANPYAVALGGAWTLHVWYRWPHPAGVGAMIAWNATGRAAKLADIGANW
jgi:hypothetical protein